MLSRSRRPLVATAVGAVVAALSLSGCVNGSGAQDGAVTTASAATPSDAPTYDPALKSFYTQRLDWKPCDDDFQCARLKVPIDYAKPDAGSIELAVLKVPSVSKKRRGSLVVNPGGPGGSGVEYAQAAGQVFSGELTRAYDVVGFDPRGVGQSAPITCLDDGAFDRFLGMDPTPDTPEEKAALAQEDTAFGKACQARNPELLGHVSTVEAAKDMDVLRAALGDSRLHYFGASYGTFLGATYAGLFPKNVGHMVLDGAMDPKDTGQQVGEGQAKGFETAFDAYVADCVADGGCPLGTTVPAAQQRVRDLLKSLDQHPLDARGQGPAGGLTEAWASYGMAYAMYDKGAWSLLTNALEKALAGDGAPLMLLAMQYTGRDEQGHYPNNMLQVINAVNCLDRSAPAEISAYDALQAQYAKKWPTFGPFMAWSGLVCGTWPVKATGQAGPITAPGSVPIVVVGTTRDPATPYESAVSLAEQLENGRLISRDGDGHTGYNKGNRCVDHAVDDYLIRDKDPGRKLSC